VEMERKITDYVHSTTFDEIPEEPLKTIRNMVLDVLGPTGSHSPGHEGFDERRGCSSRER